MPVLPDTAEPSFGELLQQALVERLITRCSISRTGTRSDNIERAEVQIREKAAEWVMSFDEARSYLLGRLLGHWMYALPVPEEEIAARTATWPGGQRPRQEEGIEQFEQLVRCAQEMHLVEEVRLDLTRGLALIVLPDVQTHMALEEAAGFLRACIREGRREAQRGE